MRLRPIVALGLAMLGLVSVTGCAELPPATAAVVNGQTITERDLQDTAVALAGVLATDEQYATWDLVGLALNYQILEILLTDGLAQLGAAAESPLTINQAANYVITQEERNQFWAANVDPSTAIYFAWLDPQASQAMTGFIDYYILNDKIQAGAINGDQLINVVSQLPVSVNPRYGSWDSQQWSLSDGQPEGALPGVLAQPIDFSQPR